MHSIHFQPYVTPPGGSSVQLCIHGKLQNKSENAAAASALTDNYWVLDDFP